MPKQGQSVESCIVTEFKKKVGDKVAVGDILFSYETDKASFEEESKFEGTVLACFFNDNDEIPCLTNVMVIGEPGESFEEFAPSSDSGSAAGETIPSETTATLGTLRGGTGAERSEASGGVERSETVSGGMVSPACSSAVSPRARRLAAEKGVDATHIAGSGPGGRHGTPYRPCKGDDERREPSGPGIRFRSGRHGQGRRPQDLGAFTFRDTR